jgi:two-component system cell cycle sensor histidine kinase/response regulator CckA
MDQKTVLVVDDEPSIRECFAAGLRLRGFSVVEAEDKAGALALLYNNVPAVDLVITDAMIPEDPWARETGPHGLEILRRARQLGRAGVLVSGREERVAEAKGQGFAAVMKPAKMQAILAALAIVEGA